MGYEKHKSGDFNPVFKFDKEGVELKGVYKGSREVVTSLGDSIVHSIEAPTGTFDFWGTGKLNYLLRDIENGKKIKIIYLGKVEAKIKVGKRNIKKDIHDFDLFVWVNEKK